MNDARVKAGRPAGNPAVDRLADVWPLFGLRICTPRLCLRLPREQDLGALLEAARAISGPGEPRLHLPWMYAASPHMERQLLQRHWRALTQWRTESWLLPLAVYRAGRPIGMQELWAFDFVNQRSVITGSWLTRGEQGKGYGTEMRAAALELAFGSLGAEEAYTRFLDGNHASRAVSRKLHFTSNGQRIIYRKGVGRTIQHAARLNRATWEEHRNGSSFEITGIEPCLAMFGLDKEGALCDGLAGRFYPLAARYQRIS
jgi:RimJ/RimL family protein N-acetyltransferase